MTMTFATLLLYNAGFDRHQRGVTLVELIVTITIMSIIAGIVAVFVQRPMQGYMDSARRADLTDKADVALRRMERDLRLALPNSVRVVTAGGVQYLEFLQMSGGGRYRAAVDTSNPIQDNVLDFTTADTKFEVLGPMPTLNAGDQIVIFNLFSSGTNSDAYYGDNRTSYSSSAGNVITIAAKRFPFESPSSRFQVVSGAVTYECNPAAGVIRRYAGYPITQNQPAPPAVTPALLVSDVSACGFTYNNAASNTLIRTGLVTLDLQVTQDSESVHLLQQVHVGNSP